MMRGASDIHLDPDREHFVVRVRVDGRLEVLHKLERTIYLPLLARIKILASLRTDEHHAAQDGRFRVNIGDGIDVRVSIAPTYYGENAVLRLLGPQGTKHTLHSLGCRSSHELLLTRTLERSHGMVLATGPTGSGKTTLLYTLLGMLDAKTRSIVSLEDPVEYSLTDITQIPVHEGRSLSFASGLRTVLRQDPDVIMVGEIRDAETARLASAAALTGHLVLTTLHTNDAASAVLRLRDLGVEPYLIAATARLVVAQRLVRRLCEHCKIEDRPKERLLEFLRAEAIEALKSVTAFYVGKGCAACSGNGYKGRIALFEMLLLDDDLQALVLNTTDRAALRNKARERGMRVLAEDGIEKIRKGLTSAEEVFRACYG